MDDFLELLQSFLSGKLAADDFVLRWIQLSREVRDEQHHILSSHPKLRQAYDRLLFKHSLGLLNEQRLEQEAKKLFASVEGCRIAPFSKADRIISHLMVEASVYEPDVTQRRPWQIGDAELLAEAQKAIGELLSDQE